MFLRTILYEEHFFINLIFISPQKLATASPCFTFKHLGFLLAAIVRRRKNIQFPKHIFSLASLTPLACCFDSLQVKSVKPALHRTIALHWAWKANELTVYTGWPRPGGPGNLASPAGAAGCLPGNGPSGNAAVSVEHHYLAGSHRQLACQTQQRGTKYIALA